ncbi:MAG TPA: Maf family protein [Parapedobacter sp.]|nr:Maf family protein [Parapedobacter sp.]
MKIILASQSPRRRELLAQMGIAFEVIIRGVDECFPDQLDPVGAVRHIAEKKAMVFKTEVTDELVIAADTIVAIDGQILGKPADRADAIDMLSRLSGKKHEVITAVSLLHKELIHTFHEVTEVYFHTLSEQTITHYVDHYQPFDKAGAYGIQEWIGLVGVEKIVGSYTNVVGLPTQQLHQVINTSFC